MRHHHGSLALVVIAASAGAPLAAQVAPVAESEAADDRAPATASQDAATGGDFDEIVVTGRAGGDALRKAEASYAITTINDATLRLTNPSSAAELFRLVPGFWVEASGGEGSNNVRARGIPTDGYSSVALQENGISVQYDGGLGYLSSDQSFRFDETIARVEAVRGGPASMFAGFAPGGVVNFITRRGTDDPGGLLRYSWGNYDLNRIDAFYGTRVGGNFGVFVGGFYRQSDGMRDVGFRAEQGGQVRATVNYDDGRNSVMLDVKHIDDRVPFYLPVPLTFEADGGIVSVPGFDPLRDTLAGPESDDVPILNVGGPFLFDLTTGSRTQLTQATLEARLGLTETIGLETRLRWKTADMQRNAVFPTGNVVPVGDFLNGALARARAAFPTTARLRAQYATDGTPLTADANGNGLVVGGNLLAVSVPIDEMQLDTRLTAEVEAAGTHSFALGVNYGGYSYRFDRYMGTTLLDVRPNARRVDVVALDAAGSVVGRVTDNGFQRYGSIFDEFGANVDNVALYAADEWAITDALRIDAAARWERTSFNWLGASKRTVSLGTPDTLADDQVLTRAGYLSHRVGISDWGWTVGANYQFDSYAGVFARYTDTYRLPGPDGGNAAPREFRSVPVKMAELGAKFSRSFVRVFATGFFTRFEGIPFVDARFNTQTNDYEFRTVFADTETFGVEVEALVRPLRGFDLSVQATWQDPQYRGFTFTEVVGGQPVVRDFDGNQLIRVPRLSIRAAPGVNLFDDRFRAELVVEHYTRRFPDIANTLELPAYTQFNVNMRTDVTSFLTLGLNATNLTNVLGLTEGNPRAGSFVAGDSNARFFLARPNFGRIVRLTATARF